MGRKKIDNPKVRYSFRMHGQDMEKMKRIRDVFGYSLTEIIEMCLYNEITLDGLYETTFNIAQDGEDV